MLYFGLHVTLYEPLKGQCIGTKYIVTGTWILGVSPEICMTILAPWIRQLDKPMLCRQHPPGGSEI